MLAVALISCGAPESDNGGSAPTVRRSESNLESSAKVAFDCFEEGECSNSFVLSINSAAEFPKYCTGYMADASNMVVPAECLTGATCENIAAKTISGKIHHCAEVRTFKDDNHSHITYNGKFSIVRLKEEVSGSLSEVSNSKMSDFNYYQLWYVDKKNDNSGYQLNRMRYNCRKTRNNVLFPSNNADSSVVAMKNCNLRDVGIGAGVVDTDTGDVLGLVHGSIAEDSTYRRYMYGRKGISLTLATPIKCALKNFQAIPKIGYEETSYCDMPVFKPGTASFSDQLHKLFRFPLDRNIKYVFTRLGHDSERFFTYREFYALEYETVPYQYPQVKVCSFSPYLTRSYELYGVTSIGNCVTRTLKIVYKENTSEKSFSIYDDFGDIAIKVRYEKYIY